MRIQKNKSFEKKVETSRESRNISIFGQESRNISDLKRHFFLRSRSRTPFSGVEKVEIDQNLVEKVKTPKFCRESRDRIRHLDPGSFELFTSLLGYCLKIF